MKVLVLDDDMARHQAFANNLARNDVTHADSYDRAVKALQDQDRFDVVFLDHDLNDFGLKSIGPSDSMYGGARELTGNDVARFIAKALPKKKRPKMVVVHSINYDGSMNIVSTLKAAGIPVRREPFHTEIRL